MVPRSNMESVLRFLISVGLAAVVTVLLFLFLHSFVVLAQAKLSENRGIRLDDFVRVKKAESRPETKKRELPQRQKPEKEPSPPDMKLETARGGGGSVIGVGPPPAGDLSGMKITGGIGGAMSDSGAIPLVRVQPIYPPSAAQQRIEGWVTVEFVITETGAVRDVRVIKAEPPRIFDHAVVQAVKKWKYKPAIENGQPVLARNVRVTLKFELEDL